MALRDRFVGEARYWYKMWSSWLAIAWGGVVYALVEDPSTLSQVLAMVPAPYKTAVPPIAFGFAAALPIIVRCLRQGGKQ